MDRLAFLIPLPLALLASYAMDHLQLIIALGDSLELIA